MKVFSALVLIAASFLMFGAQITECPVSQEKTVSEITFEVWHAYGRATGGVFAPFYNFPHNLIQIMAEVLLDDELPYIGSVSNLLWHCGIKVQKELTKNVRFAWNSRFCYNHRVLAVFLSCYWILSVIIALFFYEAGCCYQMTILLRSDPGRGEDEACLPVSANNLPDG